MKKIAKLTWLHNGNFGSVLQAVALQRYLHDKGYDVIDLDYDASLSTKLMNWFKNKNSVRLFFGKYKEAKTKKQYKKEKEFSSRGKRFSEFKNMWIKKTDLCRTPEEIRRISEDFDVFICGSDQIWSPALMNPVFYLNFVPENKKKIAYAPSFGVTSASAPKRKQISEYIKSFDCVSVRESQGQKFIKEITGQDVSLVVDPTLLLDGQIWEEYTKEPDRVKPYIFCYLLTPNEIYIHAVNEFAKKKNMEVIIIPTSKGPFDTGFDEVIDAGPAEWLGYIKKAKYVFTDSFHGCIFSSIFHKEFVLFKRFKDGNKVSENSRIYTLAKFLDVEDRIVDENNTDKIGYMKVLDFKKIDDIITQKSNESKEWLLNSLKKVGV